MHFTKGTRHKSATIPAIQLEFEGKYDKSFGTHIEIMGDYLVVLLAHGFPFHGYQTLYLVDWVHGNVICVSTVPLTRLAPLTHFSLALQHRRVSRNTFFPVLASISGNTLVLGRKRDWALELCRFTKEGDAWTFCTLCMLNLPALHPNTQTSLACLKRTSSATARTSTFRRLSKYPFRSSPSDSVLSFDVVIKPSGKNSLQSRWFFYVIPSTLRALVRAATAHPPEETDRNGNFVSSWLRRHAHHTPLRVPIGVPWGDWGPKMTRWINASSFRSYPVVSGMRCMISVMVQGKLRLHTLDFNLERLCHVDPTPLKNRNSKETPRLVTGPSTIQARGGFLHDFQSNLPYYELVTSGVIGDLVMDDEWIAIIQVCLNY